MSQFFKDNVYVYEQIPSCLYVYVCVQILYNTCVCVYITPLSLVECSAPLLAERAFKLAFWLMYVDATDIARGLIHIIAVYERESIYARTYSFTTVQSDFTGRSRAHTMLISHRNTHTDSRSSPRAVHLRFLLLLLLTYLVLSLTYIYIFF